MIFIQGFVIVWVVAMMYTFIASTIYRLKGPKNYTCPEFIYGTCLTREWRGTCKVCKNYLKWKRISIFWPFAGAFWLIWTPIKYVCILPFQATAQYVLKGRPQDILEEITKKEFENEE